MSIGDRLDNLGSNAKIGVHEGLRGVSIGTGALLEVPLPSLTDGTLQFRLAPDPDTTIVLVGETGSEYRVEIGNSYGSRVAFLAGAEGQGKLDWSKDVVDLLVKYDGRRIQLWTGAGLAASQEVTSGERLILLRVFDGQGLGSGDPFISDLMVSGTAGGPMPTMRRIVPASVPVGSPLTAVSGFECRPALVAFAGDHGGVFARTERGGPAVCTLDVAGTGKGPIVITRMDKAKTFGPFTITSSANAVGTFGGEAEVESYGYTTNSISVGPALVQGWSYRDQGATRGTFGKSGGCGPIRSVSFTLPEREEIGYVAVTSVGDAWPSADAGLGCMPVVCDRACSRPFSDALQPRCRATCADAVLHGATPDALWTCRQAASSAAAWFYCDRSRIIERFSALGSAPPASRGYAIDVAAAAPAIEWNEDEVAAMRGWLDDAAGGGCQDSRGLALAAFGAVVYQRTPGLSDNVLEWLARTQCPESSQLLDIVGGLDHGAIYEKLLTLNPRNAAIARQLKDSMPESAALGAVFEAWKSEPFARNASLLDASLQYVLLARRAAVLTEISSSAEQQPPEDPDTTISVVSYYAGIVLGPFERESVAAKLATKKSRFSKLLAISLLRGTFRKKGVASLKSLTRSDDPMIADTAKSAIAIGVPSCIDRSFEKFEAAFAGAVASGNSKQFEKLVVSTVVPRGDALAAQASRLARTSGYTVSCAGRDRITIGFNARGTPDVTIAKTSRGWKIVDWPGVING